MKKVFLFAAVLVIASAPLQAQDWRAVIGGGEPGILDVGVISSIVVDLAGYGFCLAGTYTMSSMDDPILDLVLFAGGSLVMSAGGLGWNLCLDARQNALRDKGASIPEGDRSLSWTYVWLSLGCSAGSIAIGLIDDPIAFVVSVVFSAGAMVFEMLNMTGPRIMWSAWLYNAYNDQSKSSAQPAVLPIVDVGWEPDSKTPVVFLGVVYMY